MQRRVRMIMVILSAGLFLWGCGGTDKLSETQKGTAIELHKDGSITATILDDFPEDVYDEGNEQQLKEMTLMEVAQFNRIDPDMVMSVDKLERQAEKIEVVLKYSSADAYTSFNSNAYNNKLIYYGTVKEAYDSGQSLDVALHNVKNDESISKDELMQMGDKHILIVGEPCLLKIYADILYVGDQVEVTGKKQAILRLADQEEGAEERFYLVF